MLALSMPSLPGWEGIHPLVVHFPLALLLVTPVFLLLGTVLPKRGRGMTVAALILMVLGTVFALVARESGEAAGEQVQRTDAISDALVHHADLAGKTVWTFIGLTLLYAVVLGVQATVGKTRKVGWHLGMHVPFLVLFCAGALLLAHTGHEGGRLVHGMGVTNGLAAPQMTGPPPEVAGTGTERVVKD